MEYTLCLAEGTDPAIAFKKIESTLAREFSRRASVERRRFVMTGALVRQVIKSKKTTTIRLDRRAVEYPAAAVLPLFATHADPGKAVPVGNVLVAKVVYKRLRDLTPADAKRDGFTSKRALLSALQRFYGALDGDELVSIYEIRAVGPAMADQAA